MCLPITTGKASRTSFVLTATALLSYPLPAVSIGFIGIVVLMPESVYVFVFLKSVFDFIPAYLLNYRFCEKVWQFSIALIAIDLFLSCKLSLLNSMQPSNYMWR